LRRLRVNVLDGHRQSGCEVGMRPSELMIHIFQALVWLDESLQARLHDHGWPDVSRAQSMVMLNIAGGVTRPSEIARRLGISRQAIHTTIAQMVDLGMVQLEVDTADARHKRLHLTPFGERMRADAQASMDEILGSLEARIGEAQFAGLLAAFETDWGSPSLRREGHAQVPNRPAATAGSIA
jgi:DNA-binding MarR family transcriptional regulator